MIDVYASLAIVSFVILSICFVVLKYVVRIVLAFGVRKTKNE